MATAVNILMATSEMAPLAQTGGLGDVLQALPLELSRQGHEISVVLPFYRSIKESPTLQPAPTGVHLSIPLGTRRVSAEVLEARLPGGLQLFLIRRDEYFDRSAIYGEPGQMYEDNAERFIFFDKAVVELARRMNPSPDILHCHDWTTGLIPVFVRDQRLPFGTVFTIHNLAFQGSFWGVDFGLTNLPGHYFGPKGVEFFGKLHFLKSAILFADRVTTVSEQYAHEIQTAEYGCGLDQVLRENADKLSGIINGANYDQWDPATDKLISARYTREHPKGKSRCRSALLKECKLRKSPGAPVFGMVTRTPVEKGFDLLLPAIDLLMTHDARLVILGECDAATDRELRTLERRHLGKMRYLPAYTEKGAHRILAGSDVLLAPARFEPFGLAAVHALRYGALPLVRGTGGLFQIVQDHRPGTEEGTGFVFYHYTVEGFWDAIHRAIEQFQDGPAWSTLVDRAMAADFSWEQSAAQYAALYAGAVKPQRRAA